MWLKNLSIKHFRNYQDVDIDFNPRLNVFVGHMFVKTNLLESIYFLALTRSHQIRDKRFNRRRTT